MRIRLFIPALLSAAFFSFSAGGVQAGSFFGPVCYGAGYTYQYPNRSHNLFGCGPGCHCRAWHPFFRHRLFRRNQAVPGDGMPVNALPSHGMPPVDGMPIESMPAPMTQAPMTAPPVHMTSVVPGSVPTTPGVQTRIAPVPAPMPSGPLTVEPPPADLSGQPPF
jgi:hypothetical protein